MSSPSQFISSRNSTLATCIAPQVVATIALALRGISRAKSKVRFGWDDLFAIGAVLSFWAYSAVPLWLVVTKDPSTPPQELAADELKLLYVDGFFALSTFAMAKLSILCFYKRIFGAKTAYRVTIDFLISVSVAWWFTSCMLVAFRCRPIAGAWVPKLMPTATCLNYQTIFLVTEIINCVTEVAMIVAPICMVRQLHLPPQIKIGVCIVLAIGSFTAITSIMRIIVVYAPASGSEGILRSNVWCSIQQCTGICCACLPTYRGLLPERWNIALTLQQWYSGLMSRSRSGKQSPRRSNSDDIESQYGTSLESTKLNFSMHDTHRETAIDRIDGTAVPPNGIAVQHSVFVE